MYFVEISFVWELLEDGILCHLFYNSVHYYDYHHS